jgi:hypothetical protein
MEEKWWINGWGKNNEKWRTNGWWKDEGWKNDKKMINGWWENDEKWINSSLNFILLN